MCSRIMALLFFVLAPATLLAQNLTVTGRIVDEDSNPLPGVSVVVDGTTVGTATNVEGEYTIQAPGDAVLLFRYLGYAPVDEAVGGRTRINIVMESDVNVIDDVVIVGYGSQRRVTLTGSVAAIKGDEMLKTRNENPMNMLSGKLPGVRVWQKSAEPGSYSANFDIRGFGTPLVVIDGVIRTIEDFQRLNPQDIEDLSVLKDASAAIYGFRGANGALLVTTKKGNRDGTTTVNYTGSFTFQKPSGMPKLTNAVDAMTLYNEQAMNNVNGGSLVYSEADFEAYRNGTRKSTDWNSLMFSDWSPQTQHDVSISGGNEKTQYFISMGYMYQEGFFRSGDLNYDKYNLRSNITTQIVNGLKLNLSLSGIMEEQNNPYSSTVDIIRSWWRQGALYPAYADPDNTMLNYEGLELEENPVAMMTSDVSGYRKNQQKYFQSSLSLEYDFGTIAPVLQGLTAKALYSYDYRVDNNTTYRKEYYQYAYDELTDSYISKLYDESSPSRLRRGHYSRQQNMAQFLVNYDRTINRHKISGLVGWEIQKRYVDNYYAQRSLAFSNDYLFAGTDEENIVDMNVGNLNDFAELAYNALIGRVNYTFADRYIAEVQFRYDGSSKFYKGNQWGFFPSASVGWRISEEPFFKNVSELSFVNQLKLRASYGAMGDDLQDSWEYEWITGYTYPATNSNSGSGYYNQWAPGYILGSQMIYAMNPLAIPNTGVSWYETRTFDIGIDFEGWNGLFGFSVDYFDRRVKGVFARASSDLPTVVGATAPRENANSYKHIGLEVELTHRNKIGDFSYNVRAMGSITRQKYMTAVQQGPYANSYDRWRNDNLTNRYQGVQFGYKSAGRYTSWEDIWSYQIYKDRNLLPGDYKYVDWNGDGEINSLDMHPYAYDQTPWMNFSLSLGMEYKNFDLNVLFQGSALGSMQYQEPLYSIWGSNGGGTLVQYMDRWHPVDPTADPWDPSLQWISGYYAYTGHYPEASSEFNRVSTAYLRLKSIELGYTLPKFQSMPSLNLRVFANAYNLLTFTAVKFVDPEHPDDELGRLYPLNKTFTLGLSFTF